MRRWWTKALHITLLPGELLLRDEDGEQRIPCDGAAGWPGLLSSLDIALAAMPVRKRRAIVTVADGFARHAVAPWAAGLTSTAALDGYVRMCMEEACGGSMEGWLVRHDLHHWRQPGLAIALPEALLAGLEECLARHRLGLDAVQPRFAYLLRQRRLPKDALLLLPEGQHCLLASRAGGAWHHVRMVRNADPATLAARECRLAGLPANLPFQLLEDPA